MRNRWVATHMPTTLQGISNRARGNKQAQFGGLYRLLNVENLRWCFYQLRKTAAVGVDKVSFYDYEQNLDENLNNLVDKLKAKSYHANLIRRKHIPKGNGKTRALGIPTLEDKLLQLACSKVLTAIYENHFFDCSWGYRQRRGGKEASYRLSMELYRGCYGYVVEADIQGFFDNVDREWMQKMLCHKINDKAFVHLIMKWMRAGVLEEDSTVRHPATGTPQGGVISPVLSNIYLHYLLDLWFEHVVKKESRGNAYMIRYADDFVCAFRYMKDAKLFMEALKGRLGKFNLKLAPEKTGMLRFCRFEAGRDKAFEFLGFEFRWVTRRNGKRGVQRQTSSKKMCNSIKEFTKWLKESRHKKIRTVMASLSRKFRGYWNYYGVIGNMKRLANFQWRCTRLLYKWLNRRSQRKSYTWKGLLDMLKYFQVPRAHITEVISKQLMFFKATPEYVK